MGVKLPELGSKWRLLGEYATWVITAQLLCYNTVTSKVASNETQERNGHKSFPYSILCRTLSSPNFCKKPENVAFRSMLTFCRVGSAVPSSARGNDGGSRRSWGVERERWGVGRETEVVVGRSRPRVLRIGQPEYRLVVRMACRGRS